MDSLLIRYHEIALKKGNRRYFIELLKRNLISAVKDLGIKEIRSLPARILLTFKAKFSSSASGVFLGWQISPGWNERQEISILFALGSSNRLTAADLNPFGSKPNAAIKHLP
jgi:adenylyl- and sulfurtransferase ThiI